MTIAPNHCRDDPGGSYTLLAPPSRPRAAAVQKQLDDLDKRIREFNAQAQRP
jgi:hypothetical protein